MHKCINKKVDNILVPLKKKGATHVGIFHDIRKTVLTKSKAAFTLGEVLITLAIIGVVAAVTMPLLIKNYQKKVFVTRLQKVYSDLGNAMKMGQAEYGDLDNWDWSLSGSDLFQTYLSTFKRVSIKPFSENRKVVTYYQISGQPETWLNLLKNPSNYDVVTLANGVQLFLKDSKGTSSDVVKVIYIDVNGLAKPNTFGKDVFVIHILRSGEIIFQQICDGEPTLTTRRTIEQLKTSATGEQCYNYQCNKQGRGMWCGALIQQSGWKIPDDYPW